MSALQVAHVTGALQRSRPNLGAWWGTYDAYTAARAQWAMTVDEMAATLAGIVPGFDVPTFTKACEQ